MISNVFKFMKLLGTQQEPSLWGMFDYNQTFCYYTRKERTYTKVTARFSAAPAQLATWSLFLFLFPFPLLLLLCLERLPFQQTEVAALEQTLESS